MTSDLSKYKFNKDSSKIITQDEHNIKSSKNSKIFLHIDYSKSLYKSLLSDPSRDIIDEISGKSETDMSAQYGHAYSEIVDNDKRRRYAYLPFCEEFYTSFFQKTEDIIKEDSLKIAVDTNADSTDHSNAFDDGKFKENLFKQVEEKIIEINKDIIDNAIDTNIPFKLEESKLAEIERVKKGRGTLQKFSIDDDNKYLSDKHISHIVSVVAIESYRAYNDTIDGIEQSVNNVKEAFQKVSTLDRDNRLRLMSYIKNLSERSAFKDKDDQDIDLGVGIGRNSKTRMKVLHCTADDNINKQFNDLLDTKLSAKDLTALLIIISKSIQLTNQLVAHFQDNEHNIPLTLDRMIIKQPGKFKYGKLRVEGTAGKKGELEDQEEDIALNISDVSTFDREIIRRVNITSVETAADAGDDAFSSADHHEQINDNSEMGYDSDNSTVDIDHEHPTHLSTRSPSLQREERQFAEGSRPADHAKKLLGSDGMTQLTRSSDVYKSSAISSSGEPEIFPEHTLPQPSAQRRKDGVTLSEIEVSLTSSNNKNGSHQL